jgi:hypothetical protein
LVSSRDAVRLRVLEQGLIGRVRKDREGKLRQLEEFGSVNPLDCTSQIEPLAKCGVSLPSKAWLPRLQVRQRFLYFLPSSSTSAPSATLPIFAAVSIKLSKGNDPRGRFQFQSGGRFIMTNIPLRPLIAIAFNLPPGMGRGRDDRRAGLDGFRALQH